MVYKQGERMWQTTNGQTDRQADRQTEKRLAIGGFCLKTKVKAKALLGLQVSCGGTDLCFFSPPEKFWDAVWRPTVTVQSDVSQRDKKNPAQFAQLQH